MEFVPVEVLHHTRGIGIASLVKDWFTHGVPPEPVLHNIVSRNVQLPVFVSDVE